MPDLPVSGGGVDESVEELERARNVMAFGGPWNEQVVALPPSPPYVVLAPMMAKVSSLLSEVSDPTAPSDIRQVTYHLETFAFHDLDRCPGRPLCDERCQWSARCLVADGYPKERITWQMDVVLILASWSWPFGPVIRAAVSSSETDNER